MIADNLAALLRNKYARALSIVLLAQAGLFYGASRPEKVPDVSPLSSFPIVVGKWQMVRDYPLEKEIQDILKADDTMNRAYVDASQSVGINVFLAYFKSQRAGQAPHSPKNCLPGNGWEPLETGYINIALPGESRPVRINRYVVAHGEERSVVLYWYQSRERIIASEYSAKIWAVLDSIRYHRSDTSLVKFVVPFGQGTTAGQATAIAVDAVQGFYPAIRAQLPM